MGEVSAKITTRGDFQFGRLLEAAKGSQEVTVHTPAGSFTGKVDKYDNGMVKLCSSGDTFHVRVNHITALQLHGAGRDQDQS